MDDNTKFWAIFALGSACTLWVQMGIAAGVLQWLNRGHKPGIATSEPWSNPQRSKAIYSENQL